MTVKEAVILAAGQGTRIESIHVDKPKGLIELDGIPIIEHSVRALLAVGIERMTLVTGFRREMYDAYFKNRDEVVCIYNERFNTASTLVSLLVGLRASSDDILLLESDLVYDPRNLPLLTTGHAPGSNLALISGPTQASDEVWTELHNGCVRAMSKDPQQLGSIHGEYVGINRLSAAFTSQLRRWASTLDDAHRRSLCYETDALVAVGREQPLTAVFIDGVSWGEIDYESHLQRVQKVVWPRLRGRP